MTRLIAGSIALAVALTAVSTSGHAQEASHCGGRIIAERFNTIVVPGPGGRASYSVLLRNTQGHPASFQLVVTGSFLSRPLPATRTIHPGGTMNIALGYSPNVPRVPPLRGDQLAQVTRIVCL